MNAQRMMMAAAAIGLLTLLVILQFLNGLKEDNRLLQQENIGLQHKAVQYQSLSRRWEHKGASKQLIERLKKIKAPERVTGKGKSVVLEYSALSGQLLDKLLDRILNSNVQLNDIRIVKKEGLMQLVVEMKR